MRVKQCGKVHTDNSVDQSSADPRPRTDKEVGGCGKGIPGQKKSFGVCV